VTPSKSTVGLLIGASVDDATFSGYQEVSQSITAAVQFKIECHRFRALELKVFLIRGSGWWSGADFVRLVGELIEMLGWQDARGGLHLLDHLQQGRHGSIIEGESFT
jgi:hypothetical protein